MIFRVTRVYLPPPILFRARRMVPGTSAIPFLTHHKYDPVVRLHVALNGCKFINVQLILDYMLNSLWLTWCVLSSLPFVPTAATVDSHMGALSCVSGNASWALLLSQAITRAMIIYPSMTNGPNRQYSFQTSNGSGKTAVMLHHYILFSTNVLPSSFPLWHPKFP